MTVAHHPLFDTARLRLRPLTLDDAPFILGLLNQPSFLQHIGDKGVRDLDGARQYLRDGPLAMYAQHGLGMLRLGLTDGTPIGIAGFMRREALPDPDLGYALDPSYWGAGYAHEACVALLEWGRTVRGFRRVLAIVSPGNSASLRLLAKLGMRDEGRIEVTPGDEVLLYALGTAAVARAAPAAPADDSAPAEDAAR